MTSINLSGPGIVIAKNKERFDANLAHIRKCATDVETAPAFRRAFKDGLDDFYDKFGTEIFWHDLSNEKKIAHLSPILERAQNAFKESLIIFNNQGEGWELRSESYALEWLFCCLVHLSQGYNPTVATEIASAAGYPLRNPFKQT